MTSLLRAPRTWLWLLAALTMLLHLAAGLYIGERHATGTDAGAYEQIARNLLAGRGFDCNGMKAWYAPLYPLLLTAPFGLTGHPFLLTLLAQGLLVCGLQWFCWRLTLRFGGSARAGVAAAALIALDPLTAYFSLLLLTETLFTFLALLLLWMLVEDADRPRGTGWCLLIGIVVGLSALTRPVLQGFIPLILLGWWRYAALPRAVLLRRGLALVLAAVAVMLPWLLRNYAVFGRYVPVTNQSGMALYAGNNPLNRLGGGLGGGIDYDLSRVPGHATLREDALNTVLSQAAVDYLRERPLHFLRMMPVKLARAWSLLPSDTSGHTAWYQQAVSLAWCLPVFPLFLAGLWTARGTWRRAWPLYAFLAYTLLFIAVYYGTLRFRLPLHPLLAVWAALGLQHLARRRARAVSAGGAARE